jgi:hypothetical protein
MFVNWKVENGKWSPVDDGPEWNVERQEFTGYQRSTWGDGELWVVWEGKDREGKDRWIVDLGVGTACVMITCPGDLIDLQFKLAVTDLAQLVNLSASGDDAEGLAEVVAAVEEALPGVRTRRQEQRAAAREARAARKREQAGASTTSARSGK